MALDTLQDLLIDNLKDLYSAENQLIKALPRMAKAATSPALAKAFRDHLVQTQGHVARLQKIGDMLEIKLGGKKCHGMEGLLEEGKEAMEEDGDGSVIDAALVRAAQCVEHYEIGAYGNCRTLAEALGMTQAAKLFQQTLDEESAADDKLSDICQREILPQAAAVGADAE